MNVLILTGSQIRFFEYMHKHVEVVFLGEELQHFMEVVLVKLLFVAVWKAVLNIIEFLLIVFSLLIVIFLENAECFIYITVFPFLDNIDHVGGTNILAIAVLHALNILASILRDNTVKIICQINDH